jgi:hypothetical protein
MTNTNTCIRIADAYVICFNLLLTWLYMFRKSVSIAIEKLPLLFNKTQNNELAS